MTGASVMQVTTIHRRAAWVIPATASDVRMASKQAR